MKFSASYTAIAILALTLPSFSIAADPVPAIGPAAVTVSQKPSAPSGPQPTRSNPPLINPGNGGSPTRPSASATTTAEEDPANPSNGSSLMAANSVFTIAGIVIALTAVGF
ncbi:hypothetical protein BX616_011062 [Lobosporangium transversale]|nr:hypothetical protein BX616_011062 [Lobosporangium transversale]